MRFRTPVSASWMSLLLVLVGMGLACTVESAPRRRGRAIEFSDPQSEVVNTNLSQVNQLGNKKATLKQVEDDLFRPLQQSLIPRNSLQGLPVVPYRPPQVVVPSKKAQELLEKQKNWVFMNPEDLLGAPKVEDPLKTKDSSEVIPEKSKTPTLDKFYLNLAGQGEAGEAPRTESSSKPDSANTTGLDSEGKTPFDESKGNELVSRIRKLLGTGPAGSDLSSEHRLNTFADNAFGRNDDGLPPEQAALLKARRQEANRLLWGVPGISLGASPSLEPLNPFGTISGALRAPASSASLPPATAANPFSQDAFGSLATVPVMPSLPDLGTVIQSPGFAPPAPKALDSGPVRISPQAPTFSAPKRAF